MSGGIKSRVGDIANKAKRNEVYHKEVVAKNKARKQARLKRKQEEADALAAGVELPAKKTKTVENSRKADETMVEVNDEEVLGDEATDEFAAYYANQVKPKVLMTTSVKAKGNSYDLVKEMLKVIPNSVFYSRREFKIKAICDQASEQGFTDVMIFHEDNKEINSMLLVHLPNGPTAHFKLSKLILPDKIKGHGKASNHKPEIILNNFNTRLGHRLGRMFGALFDQEPNFHGRRVVTLHNQRDFIFFRQHRYIFDDAETPRLQECGPRFTLKLKYLQQGLPDPLHAEYEFVPKKEIGNKRTDFFL